jgi:predicted dehydrogenase
MFSDIKCLYQGLTFMVVLTRRLHSPWPQLQELADSINLDTVDDVTHRHIPYGEQDGWPGKSQIVDHPSLERLGSLL